MRGAEVGLKKTSFILALVIAAGLPIVLAEPAFAQTPGGVSNVENFIRSVITVLAGLAGLVATGFFVAGNTEQLDKAKRTLTWSAIGLAIVIAAFVLANIVTTLATQAFGG